MEASKSTTRIHRVSSYMEGINHVKIRKGIAGGN